MDNNKMRLIDANKITPDSNIVNTITNLISKCGGKYNSGCVATNCNECIAKFFDEKHSHLTPTVDAEPIKYTERGLHIGHKHYCSACGYLSYIENYCSKCGAKLIKTKEEKEKEI